MNLPITVDQTQLKDVLLNVGLVRPVFIWGRAGHRANPPLSRNLPPSSAFPVSA